VHFAQALLRRIEMAMEIFLKHMMVGNRHNSRTHGQFVKGQPKGIARSVEPFLAMDATISQILIRRCSAVMV
jgi:hypothetical protein